MSVITVAERCGPICVSAEDGGRLCAQIREALDRQEDVTLDFTGVKTLASLFLNSALGCLYASYDKGFLEEKLRWAGLDPADESVVRFVKRNAIRFYEAQSAQQEALIAASRSAEE